MIELEINQSTGSRLPTSFFESWIKKVSKVVGLRGNFKVSVAIIGEAEMKKINYQSRGKKKATNVLSFAEIDLKNTKFVQVDNGYLGEVLICYPIAVKQAKVASMPIKAEVARLFVHGLLHLLGYDHIKDKQAAVMEAIEDKVFSD
ncbi:MAG: rRNA maturation RNase YbeY [Candidatus Buchananbacteria bacterium]|nr:rRNA maturation RNase YbeY [Candidatus Buchananbacteria bacterium]